MDAQTARQSMAQSELLVREVMPRLVGEEDDFLMTDEQLEATTVHHRPTEAQRAFDALTNEQKANLAESVFFVLEYDDLGEPGYEWSPDTFGSLALVFADRGVTFTPPTSDEG